MEARSFGFDRGRRTAAGAVVVILVALASCGSEADQATVKSTAAPVDPTEAPADAPTEAPAELVGAPADELSIAVDNEGVTLVVRRKPFEPSDGVAGASLVAPDGKVTSVGALPAVTSPQALAVEGGFAVGGSTCAELTEPPEADCVSSVPVVAFIDAGGKVTATTKAPAMVGPGMRFHPAERGVVAEGTSASLLYPDGSAKDVPEAGGATCGAARGDSLLLGVQDKSADPSRYEDSPGTLQAMVLDEGTWAPVGPSVEVGGKDGLRHEGDFPRCGIAMIGVSGHVMTDRSGLTDFPLQPADVDAIVGLTASQDVAVLRDGELEIISSDGTKSAETDGPVRAVSLSPDGTRASYLGTEASHITVTEVS